MIFWPTPYYYGCYRGAGHYLWDINLSKVYGVEKIIPWGYKVDGSLCPKGVQIEGRALITFLSGWTAMAFWDRSVDDRPGSNSVFLSSSRHTFGAMCNMAESVFSEIWKRFTFKIVEAPC